MDTETGLITWWGFHKLPTIIHNYTSREKFFTLSRGSRVSHILKSIFPGFF